MLLVDAVSAKETKWEPQTMKLGDFLASEEPREGQRRSYLLAHIHLRPTWLWQPFMLLPGCGVSCLLAAGPPNWPEEGGEGHIQEL